MPNIQLTPEPLTRENFAAFGDVVETDGAQHFSINSGTIERYHAIASVAFDREAGGEPIISLAVSNVATPLPTQVMEVERHPLGSQAFIPMFTTPVVTVVAPPSGTFDASQLKAFVTNGLQGFNYHPGTWHMPLIAPARGLRFVVVDRKGSGDNCDVLNISDLDVWINE